MLVAVTVFPLAAQVAVAAVPLIFNTNPVGVLVAKALLNVTVTALFAVVAADVMAGAAFVATTVKPAKMSPVLPTEIGAAGSGVYTIDGVAPATLLVVSNTIVEPVTVALVITPPTLDTKSVAFGVPVIATFVTMVISLSPVTVAVGVTVTSPAKANAGTKVIMNATKVKIANSFLFFFKIIPS